MLYGLYQSAQGAQVQATKLDHVANNVANANTTAFKRDVPVFRLHRPFDAARGQSGSSPNGLRAHSGGTSVADVVTDFRNGPLQKTDRVFDVALEGPGFLRVRDGEQEYLTRNGKLVLDADGTLVTADHGHAVLGAAGRPIRIPPGVSEFSISPNGMISDGTTVFGQLEAHLPGDLLALEKVGESLYRNPGGSIVVGPQTTRFVQGFVEGSGVEPIQELLAMTEASRGFELNMNMIQTQDASLGRLLQSAAR